MARQMQTVCQQESELTEAACQMLQNFSGDRVFAFFGAMGVGKTTFIKAICRELGVIDEVTSPTFNIVNEYQSGDGGKIYHIDFYRIKNVAEVMDLGYEEYFYSGDYCFIEWPEKIEDLLPGKCVFVRMGENVADRSRKIHFEEK